MPGAVFSIRRRLTPWREACFPCRRDSAAVRRRNQPKEDTEPSLKFSRVEGIFISFFLRIRRQRFRLERDDGPPRQKTRIELVRNSLFSARAVSPNRIRPRADNRAPTRFRETASSDSRSHVLRRTAYVPVTRSCDLHSPRVRSFAAWPLSEQCGQSARRSGRRISGSCCHDRARPEGPCRSVSASRPGRGRFRTRFQRQSPARFSDGEHDGPT